MKRPIQYDQKLADEICETIACSEKGLRVLCKENPHWPHKSMIMKWRLTNDRFGEQYARAKQLQIEALVDDILDISDDVSNDTIIREGKNGEQYENPNSEWINRSRLRIDSRKWLAAKLAPKVYGERKEVSVEESLMTKIIDKL